MLNNLKDYNEYNEGKKIIADQNKIYEELECILNERNGYKYTEKKKKHKKHFPASCGIKYDDYMKKYEYEYASCSLSSNTIKEQLLNYLKEAEMNKNSLNSFFGSYTIEHIIKKNAFEYVLNGSVLSPLDFKYNLFSVKKNNIKQFFPEFVAKDGRTMYKKIYSIKTCNPHYQINNNEEMQDTILICIEELKNKKSKTFHVMFGLNKLNNCCSMLKGQKIVNTCSEKMYYDKNI